MMSAVLVSVMGKGGGGRELPLHCAALGFTSARKRATMRPAVLLLLVGFPLDAVAAAVLSCVGSGQKA